MKQRAGLDPPYSYEVTMKLVIEKPVTVVTPTTSTDKLIDCLDSVQKQTYKNVKHLIVVDGRQYAGKVYELTGLPPKDNVDVLILNENTGKTHSRRRRPAHAGAWRLPDRQPALRPFRAAHRRRA